MTGSDGRLCILNFHGVGVPHSGVPEAEKPYWVSRDMFTDIAQKVAARQQEGTSTDIRITFDDGNLSDLGIAALILSDLHLRGEFFVLTGRLDQDLYLNPADVRTLRDMGMGIGLHGQAHVDWRQLDEAGLAVETRAARKQLEDVTGQPIDSVAIPFGAYNRRVIAHLKAEKFNTIYTSDAGCASASARVQARTSVRGDMTGDAIDAIILDHQPISRRLKRALSTTLRRYVV